MPDEMLDLNMGQVLNGIKLSDEKRKNVDRLRHQLADTMAPPMRASAPRKTNPRRASASRSTDPTHTSSIGVKRGASEVTSEFSARKRPLLERFFGALSGVFGYRIEASEPAVQKKETVEPVAQKKKKNDSPFIDECCVCSRKANLQRCKGFGCFSFICGSCGDPGQPFECKICTTFGPIGTDYIAKECDTVKRMCNIRFIKCVQAALRENPAKKIHILALDDMNTSNYLCERHREEDEGMIVMHIPNPCECDLEYTAASSRAHSLEIRGRYCRASEWLSSTMRNGGAKLTCAWLDYCGTYDGNKSLGVCPKEDARRLWSYGLDRSARRVCVAFTFCFRKADTPRDEVVRQLTEMAALSGWNAKIRCRIDYGNQMMFLMFWAKPM